VQIPLMMTCLSQKSGMGADKLGVGWMVLVATNGL
jgi:hypothetical protein